MFYQRGGCVWAGDGACLRLDAKVTQGLVMPLLARGGVVSPLPSWWRWHHPAAALQHHLSGLVWGWGGLCHGGTGPSVCPRKASLWLCSSVWESKGEGDSELLVGFNKLKKKMEISNRPLTICGLRCWEAAARSPRGEASSCSSRLVPLLSPSRECPKKSLNELFPCVWMLLFSCKEHGGGGRICPHSLALRMVPLGLALPPASQAAPWKNLLEPKPVNAGCY